MPPTDHDSLVPSEPPHGDGASTSRETLNERFHEARALEGAQRDTFLRALDPGMRAEIEQLLAADLAAADLLSPPSHSDVAAWTAAADTRLGQVIGGCTVTRLIARGGMGVVYEAQQHEPKRIVAVKLLRTTLGREEDILRFRHEARIIARLQHPGIAQVYAAGTAEDGSPYLVMEYVRDAQDLISHAKDLSRRAQIDLFCRVCDAVQHGHGQGVIHRDLKPANVLVDGTGVPRLIDFGIARLLDDESESTRQHFTATGAVFGTLAYLSPEQIKAGSSSADTRSDVYALGVMLYGVLTGGETPYGDNDLSDFDLAQHIVQSPLALTGLSGDLRLIVRKALRKDPSERYASVESLAADLRRVLAQEPISARPPSMRYQVGMFARRHRASVAAAAIVVLGLAVATVWSVLASIRADKARALAETETQRAQGMLLESQRLVGAVVGELDNQLAQLPGSLGARTFLGDTVQERLDALALHAENDPRLRQMTAEHYGHLGALNAGSLGRTEQGLVNLARAADVLDELRQTEPANAELARTLAWVRTEQARALAAQGKYDDAAARRAVAYALLDDLPDSMATDRLRANLLLEEATSPPINGPGGYAKGLLRLRQVRDLAQRHRLDTSLALDERRAWALKLFNAAGSSGAIYAITREKASSEEALAEARDAWAQVQQLSPDGRTWPREQGLLAYYEALYQLRYGTLPETVARYAKAIGHLEEAVRREPRDRALSSKLGTIQMSSSDRLARLAYVTHKQALPLDVAKTGTAEQKEAHKHALAAIRNSTRASEIFRDLAEQDPASRLWKIQQMKAWLNLVPALTYLRQHEEAIAWIRKCLALAPVMLKEHPDESATIWIHGRAWEQLGQTRVWQGELAIPDDPIRAQALIKEGREAYVRSMDVIRTARDEGHSPKMADAILKRLTNDVAFTDRMLQRAVDAQAKSASSDE